MSYPIGAMSNRHCAHWIAAALVGLSCGAAFAAEDILNADFEAADYGAWQATGEAFGKAPAQGAVPPQMPVDGFVGKGLANSYMLGTFDGPKFTAESGPHRHYFGSAYAGQTYDNAPAGRRVHIGWMRAGGAELQGAPFNCQMTLPMDFTLRNSGGAVRLWAEPSEEVIKLRESTKEWKNLDIGPEAADPLADFSGGQFEIEAVIDADSKAAEMGFNIFAQHPAVWNKADQSFTGAEGKQAPVDGKLRVRLFVDTVSLEVFINGTYTSRYLRQTPGTKPVRIVATGGAVHFESLKIHTLRSVWK